MPDKLRDMKQLFTMQAEKYNVFPLDDRTLPRFIGPKPSYTPGRTVFKYTGELTNVPFPGVAGAPNVLNKSYTMTAEVEIPDGGAEGMLVTDGGRFAGYGFYLLKGVPVFTWNLLQLDTVKWQGKEALSPGKHTLQFDEYDGPGLGKGGTGTLKVDGEVVDTKPMPKSLPVGIGWVRDVQCRHRHRYVGGRPGLPGAFPLHRHDRQADRGARTGRADACGTGDDLRYDAK